MLTDKKINNELINKLKYLHSALIQADQIIDKLKKENETLKNIIDTNIEKTT